MRPPKKADSSSQVSARFSDGGKASGRASVVVVGTAPVNRIVVTRIAEGAGLRAFAQSPDDAIRSLSSLSPTILVIDGGADDRECDALVEAISEARRSSGQGHPRLLFLATGPNSEARSQLQPMIDAVVAKPIIPDRLQPVLLALVRQAS
jgi:CheY-like chemotaxis protein